MARKTKRTSKRSRGKASRKKSAKRPRRKAGSKSFVNAVQRLKSLRPSQRVNAMKLANDKFIQQFCKNVKKLKHAPVSTSVRKRLRHQSKKLGKLVSGKTSIKVKRKMLTQRGGILPLIIGPLIGAIARGLLGKR